MWMNAKVVGFEGGLVDCNLPYRIISRTTLNAPALPARDIGAGGVERERNGGFDGIG